MFDAAPVGSNGFVVENADFEGLDEVFQRFAIFWYRHRRPSGEIPTISALDAPDAPMMWVGGAVLAIEHDREGRASFRVRYAADEFRKNANTPVEGRSPADIMDGRRAADTVKVWSRVLRGDRPHYRRVASPVRPHDGILMKRIAAPFADERGQRTFVAGLWRFVSG